MADPAGPTGTKRLNSITNDNTLKYAFDAGFLPTAPPLDDSPETIEFEAADGEESDQSSESDDLAASLRVVSESMLRMELAELKMIKEREALRLEAEKRRMESESQMTQLMLQTQLQIASIVCPKSSIRKRKRSDDVNLGAPERVAAMLMGLLQCNLISGLDPM